MLEKYDIGVETTAFPRVDGARPSAGVVSPMLGDDVRLRLTPRG